MPDGSATNVFQFERAVRKQTWAIIGLAGPSGGGKTWTALELAAGLAQDGRIALISTEGTRDLYYADHFDFDRVGMDSPFTPERCLAAMKAAQDAGYRVVIFDSFTDEYVGEGGLADMVEKERAEAIKKGWTVNDAALWARPKAEHKKVIRWIRNSARCHLIFAMRAEEKVKFVKAKKNGRDVTEVVAVGYQPIAEKSFMYDMMESALLLPQKLDDKGNVVLADARGVPQWIKPMSQHIPFFPENKPITREAGRLLAAWCAGGAPAPASEPAVRESNPERETKAAAMPRSPFWIRRAGGFDEFLTVEEWRDAMIDILDRRVRPEHLEVFWQNQGDIIDALNDQHPEAVRAVAAAYDRRMGQGA